MAIFLTVKQKKQYMELQRKARAYEQMQSYKAQAVTRERWLLETAHQQQWEMPDPRVHWNQAELYRLVPAVMTACEMVMKLGKSQGYNVKEIQGKDQKDIDNHPFENLLRRPNPEDSRSELMAQIILSRMVAGNTYIWLNRDSKDAPPDEMWFIPADKIVPVPDERLYLRGYLYDPLGAPTPPTGGVPLETWEVIHLKRPNPFNRFVGLSALEALAVTAYADTKAREWNLKLFGDNNARLEGIIALADPINDPDWARMKADFKSASDKREQIFLRGVGKGGIEWLKAAATQREMEFLAGLQNNQQVIYDGLAPGLASMLAVNANEANARVGEMILKNYTVWPLLEEISDKFILNILPAYGDNLTGEFDDIRISDRAMELQEQQQYEKTHVIDEIRKQYYQDGPIGDERGKLLIAEVKSAASPFGNAQTQTQPGQVDENNQPDNVPEEDAAQKAVALTTWRRAALNHKPGERVPFTSPHIDKETDRAIQARLSACKSKADIRAVFDGYIAATKSNGAKEHIPNAMELKLLLETAIKAARDAA